MRETLLTRVLVLVAAVGCMLAIPAKGAAQGQELQSSAQRIMELLRSGDTPRISALLHYPPFYSSAERAKDEAGVRAQLDFLLERFGKIDHSELAKEPFETLDLGVSGGTIPYLKSLEPIETVDITYATAFEHEGAGAVKIQFLKVASGWEPFKVSLCLPMSRPDARAAWEEIVRKMTAYMAHRETEI